MSSFSKKERLGKALRKSEQEHSACGPMHVILEGPGVSLTTGSRRQSHVKGFEDLEGKLFKWISAFKLEYLCLASLTDRRAQGQCPTGHSSRSL